MTLLPLCWYSIAALFVYTNAHVLREEGATDHSTEAENDGPQVRNMNEVTAETNSVLLNFIMNLLLVDHPKRYINQDEEV